MIPVSWEEHPPYIDLDLTDHDDMLKDWYLGDECIDALEMNNPPVELDALSELRNPVLYSGAVLYARPRECAKQSSLDHSQTLDRSCSGAKVVRNGKRHIAAINPNSAGSAAQVSINLEAT